MAREPAIARLKDWGGLLAAFYRVSFIEVTKSPANLWLSTGLQLFYYAAQALFWLGIRNTAAGRGFMSEPQLFGFLVTLGLVDNLYLCFVGPGSLYASAMITEGNLERHLLWPRSPLGVLIFCRPNLSYLPCVFLSLTAAAAFYLHYHVGPWRIILHLAAVLCGVFVLNAISFIYRLTSFWTSSIVRVRNSNPSFKIMVRPLGAFEGKLKIFLMTLFPALYITAVPAGLLSPEMKPLWLAAGALGAGLLWFYVHLIWTAGVRRYGRIAA